jgi:hypothetical protein
MNTQTTRSFVIVLFLTILAGPPVLQVVAEAQSGEWPTALEVFKQPPTPENLRAYEKGLQDASITARALRPVMQLLQFFLLREAGEKALVGPHGWLFYQPGVSYLTQRAKPVDSTVHDAVAAVRRFREDLAARGIHLIVMPAPNKESVYPDQLSRCATPPTQVLSEETRAFLAQCAAAGVEVVDLFALYRDARTSSRVPLYLEQDSHWSPVGMEMAARAVAARIIVRGWLAPGTISYEARPSPVEELGDIVRMLRSPQIEARVSPQFIPTSKVVRRDTNTLFTDDPSPEVLVLGDSFLRIYERDAPGGAGFVAHLARALRRRVAGIINDGGASTLVRQELFRRPRHLTRAKVVVWEFVERDIRLGTEGWQIVPLPPLNAAPQPVWHAAPRTETRSCREEEIIHDLYWPLQTRACREKENTRPLQCWTAPPLYSGRAGRSEKSLKSVSDGRDSPLNRTLAASSCRAKVDTIVRTLRDRWLVVDYKRETGNGRVEVAGRFQNPYRVRRASAFYAGVSGRRVKPRGERLAPKAFSQAAG